LGRLQNKGRARFAPVFGYTGRALPDVRDDVTNNLDLGANKNNRFLRDGRMNLQFRAEFFNLLTTDVSAIPG
jgi:hypothetical protein